MTTRSQTRLAKPGFKPEEHKSALGKLVTGSSRPTHPRHPPDIPPHQKLGKGDPGQGDYPELLIKTAGGQAFRARVFFLLSVGVRGSHLLSVTGLSHSLGGGLGWLEHSSGRALRDTILRKRTIKTFWG